MDKKAITIRHSQFFRSFTDPKLCPTDRKAFVFLGRSNVGKSSLLNFLCDQKQLAKISKKPGKTHCINYFLIDHNFYFVDLPGYGFAKVSKKLRQQWLEMMHYYLLHQPYIVSIFLLIDFSIPPQQIDLEVISWLASSKLPFHLVFTKSDKNSPQKNIRQIQLYQKELSNHSLSLETYFITSSYLKKGQNEIITYCYELLKKP